ncbi:MAG: hypothetical protein GX282_04810 [Campylobacteraceae bacterium]|nr:hypothetical protein [Campylobacteraceae bacterium]
MRIDNLTRLMHGTLLNSPQISSVESFTFNLKDVSLGSAFLAVNASDDDVQTAIEKGAYAIIFDNKFEVKNSEIAYIKVENLKNAMFKLMRFMATLNALKFIYVTPLMMKVLRHSKISPSVKFVDSSTEELFIDVMKAKSGELFFSDDRELIEKITLNFSVLEPKFDASFENSGSLFFSKFRYKDENYTLNLPQIFMPEIWAILEFMDKNGLEIKFRDFRGIGHFEPIFVDKFYQVKGFGESYRAFIVESDEALFIRASEFLNSKFRSGIITMSPANSNLKTDIKFANLDEIKVTYDFHYALILGDKDEILASLNSPKKEASLFDF